MFIPLKFDIFWKFPSYSTRQPIQVDQIFKHPQSATRPYDRDLGYRISMVVRAIAVIADDYLTNYNIVHGDARDWRFIFRL